MQEVTTDGTSARVFAGASYASGGKTGTAQAVTIGQKDRYDARKLEEHQRDHSLYVAFAPVEQPRIALAVVVENAGFGSAHAAPIARRVFDYLLADQYPNEQDLKAVQRGEAASPIGTPLVASEIQWPLDPSAPTPTPTPTPTATPTPTPALPKVTSPTLAPKPPAAGAPSATR
jgi:penicillin-binding protein 2